MHGCIDSTRCACSALDDISKPLDGKSHGLGVSFGIDAQDASRQEALSATNLRNSLILILSLTRRQGFIVLRRACVCKLLRRSGLHARSGSSSSRLRTAGALRQLAETVKYQ